MHKDLAISDLGDLVVLPLAAVLATHRKDGSLLLSPVWHEYRDGAFYVSSISTDVKVRHLRRDPQVSFLLFESDPPYRGVELTTSAEISEAGDHDVLARIATRYLGGDAGRYVETAEDDVVVRLAPGKVRAWDFADVVS